MAKLVHSLDDPAARLPAAAGSKGATLARMRAMGLPVPPGFVITTDAFAAGGFSVPEHLVHELGAADPTDYKAVDALAAQLRRSVQERGVPGEVASQAIAAYEAFGAGRVSVRSSATGEDLERASFAGLYDSFLNILDHDQLVVRILDVWVSLFSTRAVSYRLVTGVFNDSMAMAVVVQRLVEADASGVLFTRDPVTGSTADYWVNVSYGLGEGVVTGASPADIIAIDKKTGSVTSSTIADKTSQFGVDAAGGITERSVPASTSPSTALRR
jgi:pyruvate,water dikinase